MATSSSNYKILMEAQIKPDSVRAQISNLEKSLRLNLKLDFESNQAELQGKLNQLAAAGNKLGKIRIFEDDKGGISHALVEYKNQFGQIEKTTIGINSNVNATKERIIDYGKALAEAERLQKNIEKTTARQADEMARAAQNADKFIAKAKTMAGSPKLDAAVHTAKDIKVAVADGDIARVRELTSQLDIQRASLSTLRTGLSSWTEGMRNAMRTTLQFSLSAGVLFGAFSQIKKAIGYVSDLNKEMTKIQVLQVEGAKTDEQVASLAVEYNNLAKALGATTIEVAQGSTEFLRQGKTIAETKELLRSTIQLSKLGNLESAESTEALTSILNSYKLEAEDASRVVDHLVQVDNLSATSAGELATALRYVAASASEAGIPLEKMISYIATVSSTTRISAETIGQAMKTMLQRMQDIKAGKIDDDGLGINNVESALARVDIKLRDSATSFRNFDEVLEELAGKWDTLNEVEQANISKAIAGVRQANIFAVLMTNMNKAIELQTAQMNDLGVANDRYKIQLENVEAAQNRVTASWEALASSAVTKEMITGFLNGAAGALDFVNAIGGIPAILKVIIPLMIALNLEWLTTQRLALSNAITTAVASFRSLASALFLVNPAMAETALLEGGVATGLNAISVSAGVATLGMTALIGAFIWGIGKIHEFKVAQDEILNSLKETNQETIDTASTYEEYSNKVRKAAEDAGYLIDESGKMYHEGYHGAKIYVEGMQLLTEEQWKANRAAEDGDYALRHLSGTMTDAVPSAEDYAGSVASLSDSMKELTDTVADLQGLIEKAESGKFEFSDLDELAKLYPEYLEALSMENGQLKLNTDTVRAYAAAKADAAVQAAIARDASAEEVAILQAYADQLRGQQYVMIGNLEVTAQTASQIFMSIAQNAALSGNSFVDLQGKALTSADAIYKFMSSGDAAFNSFVQQAAKITGQSVQQIMSQINAMINQTIGSIGRVVNLANGIQIGNAPSVKLTPSPIFSPAPSGYQYPGGLADYNKAGKSKADKEAEKQRKREEAERKLQSEIDKAQRAAEDSLKAQLKGYKDIIDARKKLLDSMKEERDYQQEVEEKNKNILNIQNELAALQFDTSQEANARRLQLQDELNDAQKELRNTQEDRSIEMQKDALDAQYDAFETTINKAIDAIKNISANSMGSFASQLSQVLATIGNPEVHHEGVHSGFVGKTALTKNSDEFATLLKRGELLVNPPQMDRFMTRTLPQLIQNSSSGGNVEISMPLQVMGNLDRSCLPDIEKIVNKAVEKLNGTMMSRGINRRADLFGAI